MIWACWLPNCFKGRTVLLLPFPRHLERCCGLQNHAILDHQNQPLPMADYAKQVGSFISQQESLRLRKVEMVPFNDVFQGDFGVEHLQDGVHLSDVANRELADFILRTLREPATLSPPPPPHRSPLLCLAPAEKCWMAAHQQTLLCHQSN